MKNVKEIIKKNLPKILFIIYHNIRTYRKYRNIKNILSKNINIKTNRDIVYIIGNGPSIGELNLLESTQGNDVIVMNSFYNHPQAEELKIVAYCIGETGAELTAGIDLKKLLKIKAEKFWFSSDYLKIIDPSDKQIHIYLSGDDSKLKNKKYINLKHAAPSYETTAQMALIIGIAMGYKNIKLLGFDHNFLVCGQYLDHFYNEKESDDSSRSNMYVNGADYHALMKNCINIWARYKLIKNYADNMKIKIMNCTKKSYLDVFPFQILN